MTTLTTIEQVTQFTKVIRAARNAGCMVTFDYCDGVEYNDPKLGDNSPEAPEFAFGLRGTISKESQAVLASLGFIIETWTDSNRVIGSNAMIVKRGLVGNVKFPADQDIHNYVKSQLGLDMTLA